MVMRLFAILFFITSGLSVWGHHQRAVDSMARLIASNPHDTVVARTYINWGEYIYLAQPDSALILWKKAVREAQQRLRNKTESKKITRSLKKQLADALHNCGYIYNNTGDIPKALDYYYKSLHIFEEINDLEGMSYAYNNIGFVHRNLNEIETAISLYEKSLAIRKKLKDKKGIATSLNNIGSIYEDKGKYAQALKFYEQSLAIREEIGDRGGIGISLNNVGAIYRSLKKFETAISYFKKSASVARSINNNDGVSIAFFNMGNVYFEQKKYLLASACADTSLQAAYAIGFPENILKAAKLMVSVNARTGDYKRAFEMLSLFNRMNDSINNMANKKSVLRSEAKYRYMKKAVADSVRHSQERALKDVLFEKEKAQRKNEQTLKYGLLVGLIIVAGFSFFVYNRLRVTGRQKQIIEEQKKEVEYQKELFIEKNKEILDSIGYSKRIQDSILPTDAEIKALLPQSFVLFRPKDIVSGDFYFIEPIRTNDGNTLIGFAAADSTGHGVPGAFMSIMGTNILRQSLHSPKVNTPAEALDFLNSNLQETFRQNSRSQHIQDGMDIAFCVLNPGNRQLYFAGANNPLWIIKGIETNQKELVEVKPDKQPIGYYKGQKPFTNHVLQLTKGDMVYLFSDGYADQFGGPKGKKFKYKQLQEILLSCCHLGAAEQMIFIEKTFDTWKSGFEQTDDVCLIGVQI